MFQRRKYPRLNKDYQLTYHIVDKDQFAQDPVRSFAVNISGGGMCFETSEALEKGALIALEIKTNDFPSPILALARIAWCKARGQGFDVGAEFWWIGWRDSEVQTALADFVAAHPHKLTS